MKKLLLFVLAATAFAACSTDTTQDLAPEIPTAPDELQVSFDEEDTRIQLQNNVAVWTEGDLVSVFYRSNAHDKYEFTGETGDTSGTLKRVSQGTPTVGLDKVVAIYPYNENYLLSLLSGNIKASLPAEQTDLADSYGLGSSLMVSSSKTDLLYLKNVCGWLKLQFTGEGTIEKIVLRGNNGEQVAGDIYICSDDASCTLASELTGADGVNSGDLEGALVGTNTILTELTLNCGNGVALNSETPTAFYVALPPQTFARGITITATCDDGTALTKATENAITVERNHIVPMATLTIEKPQVPDTPNTPAQPTPPANEIWYTSKDGNIVEPYFDDEFGGATLLSNTYEEGKGIMKFNGNVTEVGYYAFYECKKLESINIPNSVTEIGNRAFCFCDALTSVTIPDSVTTIELYAFGGCSALTSVTIPDSVTTIGNSAFNACYALTSITIPNSVTTIGEEAFYECSKLESVTIGNSVTSIGEDAFRNCDALESFYGKFASEDNRCLVIDGVLHSFAPAGLTSYTIPNSVTTIGDDAFYNCDALTSVTIPDSVTTIGNRAFCFCDALTSVTIGNGVTEIGDYAFRYCRALTSVTIPDKVTTIGMEAFRGCYALTNVTIGDSVTTIEVRAFYNCEALTRVTIGNSVTTIEQDAFYNCEALTRVDITDLEAWCKISFSNGVTNPLNSAGGDIYLNGELLENLVIPESITELKGNVFRGAKCIKSVTIHNKVTSIGGSAFYDCSALKKVYCKPITPPTGNSGMFANNASGRKIYVPTASVDAYKSKSSWSSYKSYIEPYNFTE